MLVLYDHDPDWIGLGWMVFSQRRFGRACNEFQFCSSKDTPCFGEEIIARRITNVDLY